MMVEAAPAAALVIAQADFLLEIAIPLLDPPPAFGGGDHRLDRRLRGEHDQPIWPSDHIAVQNGQSPKKRRYLKVFAFRAGNGRWCTFNTSPIGGRGRPPGKGGISADRYAELLTKSPFRQKSQVLDPDTARLWPFCT